MIKALILFPIFLWLAISVGMVLVALFAVWLVAVWLVGTIVMALYEGVQEGRRA